MEIFEVGIFETVIFEVEIYETVIFETVIFETVIFEVGIFEIGTCRPVFDGAVGSPLVASIGAHQHCLNKNKSRVFTF